MNWKAFRHKGMWYIGVWVTRTNGWRNYYEYKALLHETWAYADTSK